MEFTPPPGTMRLPIPFHSVPMFAFELAGPWHCFTFTLPILFIKSRWYHEAPLEDVPGLFDPESDAQYQ